MLTQQIFDAYCQRKGIELDTIRFFVDGRRLPPENTVKMVGNSCFFKVNNLNHL